MGDHRSSPAVYTLKPYIAVSIRNEIVGWCIGMDIVVDRQSNHTVLCRQAIKPYHVGHRIMLLNIMLYNNTYAIKLGRNTALYAASLT